MMNTIGKLHLEIPIDQAEHLLKQTIQLSGVFPNEDGVPNMRHMVPLRCGSAVNVGRDRSNDLPIKSMLVSRFHAVISTSPIGVVVSDLTSMNGTYVNGDRIEAPVTLTEDATIQIGDINMRVEILPRAIENLQRFESNLDEEERDRELVILMADVENFKELSDEFPHEIVTDTLVRWFGFVRKIVEEQEGGIDRKAKDQAFAIWAEEDPRESAELAYNAAMEIHQKSSEFEWEFQEQHPWRCRLILHMGKGIIDNPTVTGIDALSITGENILETTFLNKLAIAQKVPIVVSQQLEQIIQRSHALHEKRTTLNPEEDDIVFFVPDL